MKPSVLASSLAPFLVNVEKCPKFVFLSATSEVSSFSVPRMHILSFVSHKGLHTYINPCATCLPISLHLQFQRFNEPVGDFKN